MEFREKLRRAAAGVNKAKVGRAAGLQANTISSYIATGSLPRADIALKMARALGVPLEWLVDDDAPDDPPNQHGQTLAHVSDADLMREACRRLDHVAASVFETLAEAGKVNWNEAAKALLSVPVDQPIPKALARQERLVRLLEDALEQLRAFDASHRIDADPDARWNIKAMIENVGNQLYGFPYVEAIAGYRYARKLAESAQRQGDSAQEIDHRRGHLLKRAKENDARAKRGEQIF